MQAITTIGLDIAKSVFQVHGVDAQGEVIIRRQLKRRYVLASFQKLPACLVGVEACASSHHWSRELKALGHTVRVISLRCGIWSLSGHSGLRQAVRPADLWVHGLGRATRTRRRYPRLEQSCENRGLM
jgi:hypothetical protein